MSKFAWLVSLALAGCHPLGKPGGARDPAETGRPQGTPSTRHEETGTSPSPTGTAESGTSASTRSETGSHPSTGSDSGISGTTTGDTGGSGTTGPLPVGLRPTMVVIAAGTQRHGCTAAQRDECGYDESPVVTTTLRRSFELSATEVTQAQFTWLMGHNPSYFLGDELPVDQVNWHQAAAYANALSELEKLQTCYACRGRGDGLRCESEGYSVYACAGYRLPTEAEWEHAARCFEDLKYAGSDDVASVAWYYLNSKRQSHRVGSRAPNACGVYDLSGNVEEWVNDWYGRDVYERRSPRDPAGPVGGDYRVVRGGSWYGPPGQLRVADRQEIHPTSSDKVRGFRVARTVPWE